MSIEDLTHLASHNPELFRAPFGRSPWFKTLHDLGFTSAAEALKHGYLLLRAHAPSGSPTYPGIWILPKDLPLLHDAIAQIEHSRAVTETTLKTLETEEVRKLQKSQFNTVLNTLASVTETKRALIEAQCSVELLDALSHSKDSIVTATLRFYSIKNPQLTQDFPLLDREWRVKRSSTITRDILRLLLAGKESGIDQVLHDFHSARAGKAAALLAIWEPTRPAWFRPEALRQWIDLTVAGPAPAHPLLSGKSNDTFLKAAKAGVITIGGLPTRVELSAQLVIDALWAVTQLDKRRPFDRLQAIATELAMREINAEVARFVAANEDYRLSEALEVSAEEWQKLCTESFYQTLGPWFSAKKSRKEASKRLLEKMAVLKLEASATRCRSDLPRSLKDFYPIARAMGRRITFISGPTNSGKTYQALQQLSRAPSGAYLGPLRLLALEIYDKLTGEGVQTSLITGELVQIAPGATHIAATIEMLDVTAPIDTVVIDEVQMLSDRERGPAWLHAVLGAPAKHVILVGAPSALPAVRQLAALTQEPLTEVSLERLNPLNVMERPVGLKDLPKGSALIVFSRQAALSFANHLREQHHRKVSVVYGALSPEVRKEQARLFREGLTDIVVATDAIGMGLNLPIQTLIFSTSVKWDGKAEVQLEHALTWQISGRAGRYGLHESGEVGGLDPATLKHIRSMLAEQPPPLRPPFFYGLTLPIAIAIARQLGTERLGLILTFFADRLHLEEWALSRVSEDQNALAELLDSHELSLETRLTLSHAPARHARVLNPLFKLFLKTLANGEAQVIPKTRQYSLLGGALHLENMESQVRDLTLYSWMHYRWPELFPQIEESQSRLLVLNDTITQALAKEPGRRCKECAKPMPWNAAYGICEDCFSERKRYRDAVYA